MSKQRKLATQAHGRGAKKEGSRRERALLAALLLVVALFGLSRLLPGEGPTARAPAEAQALLQRGMEQRRRGDLDGAADTLRRTAALAPNWPHARLHLGAAYYDAGEYDLARQEWEHVVRLAPEDAAGWGQLGKLHLATGELEKAEKALQRAIRLEPNRVTFPSLLGEVYRQRGDPASAQKAVLAFQQALALAPRHAIAHQRLGLVYQHLGRLPEAAAALTAATLLAPDDPEAHYALAQVQRRLGRHDSAARALRTFQRLEQKQRGEEDRRDRSQGQRTELGPAGGRTTLLTSRGGVLLAL